MPRTAWPPLAANPCMGVRAQVSIIKDTNKTHQHVALSHVGKKKQKCCLWPADLAQAVCFSDVVLHSSFGALAVFWKYLRFSPCAWSVHPYPSSCHRGSRSQVLPPPSLMVLTHPYPHNLLVSYIVLNTRCMRRCMYGVLWM